MRSRHRILASLDFIDAARPGPRQSAVLPEVP